MNRTPIETKRLKLVLQTSEDVRALIEGMTAAEQAEISADWLALVHDASSASPWVHGFKLVHRTTGETIGNAGFKGPPGADSAVEIAYGVFPEYQGNGYATEAAEALATFAFLSGQVRVVRAHTLPEPNASTRVLTKCGFKRVGEVIDPEDGLVWRWEKLDDAT